MRQSAWKSGCILDASLARIFPNQYFGKTKICISRRQWDEARGNKNLPSCLPQPDALPLFDLKISIYMPLRELTKETTPPSKYQNDKRKVLHRRRLEREQLTKSPLVYLKCVLNAFWNVKQNLNKCSHTHLSHPICLGSCFTKKPTFCGLCKNTKFDAKISFFTRHLTFFNHMSFFRET